MDKALSRTETEVPYPLMVMLNDLIRESIGLYFPENRWPELQRKIMIMGRDLNIGNAAATVQWLLDLPQQRKRVDLLTSYLTIGETFFFRDQEVWDLLRQTIIPERMASKTGNDRQFTMWSAACSSGEEPYTIAMIVAQTPALESWDVTILATDINKDFLAKARKGDYSKWSFRNMSSWLVAKFFNKINDNCYRISSSLRNRITFLQLNLAGNNFPSGMNHTLGVDVIFCRNVLMYFPPKLRQRVINRLYMALNPQGWLLLAASEVGFIEHPGLAADQVNGVHLFRKHDAHLSNRDRQHLPPPLSQKAAARPISRCAKKNKPGSPVAGQDQALQHPKAKDLPAEKKTAESEENASLMTQYQTAEKLFQDRCYEQARIKLQELLAGDDQHLVPHFRTRVMALLAKVHANEGNLTEARSFGEQAIARDKLNTGYYYFLATVCQEQGEKLEAVRLLKQSLYLDHNFVLAHFQLASLVTDQEEAKKYLKNAISLLSALPTDEELPGSDGLTAGRLRETAQSMMERIGE